MRLCRSRFFNSPIVYKFKSLSYSPEELGKGHMHILFLQEILRDVKKQCTKPNGTETQNNQMNLPLHKCSFNSFLEARTRAKDLQSTFSAFNVYFSESQDLEVKFSTDFSLI